MIDQKFLDKKYYLDHMSMFLKNSYGMIEREEVYRSILLNIDYISELLAQSFNIFDDNYFELNDLDKDSTTGVMLDIIASIYGKSRIIVCNYNGTPELLTLTNKELLTYIKVVITNLNYHGTYKEIVDLYNDLGIKYSYTSPLECTITCNNTDYGTDADPTTLGKLIKSGDLLIRSLGVHYTITLSATFVNTFDNGKFDNASTVFGA